MNEYEMAFMAQYRRVADVSMTTIDGMIEIARITGDYAEVETFLSTIARDYIRLVARDTLLTAYFEATGEM